MNSPFKFLDAYTAEDRNCFFGRDVEIEMIYTQIYKSRMLLIYGQSGTGKTSLIQCGLGGHFHLTDWYPFYIRRNNDINQSLQDVLTAPLDAEVNQRNIPDTIALLYKTFLRPVYLIFDQMEELFILGTTEEQHAFIQTIKAILDAELPCKIILVLREEYIAHLYYFEQVIPSLFDRRIRVEPMNYANASKVITGSCEKFNIGLETPAENVKAIINQISVGKSGIQLPYLQVYLDRLWQEDYERTYPDGLPENAGLGPGQYPALQFTAAEIGALGDIEDVLENFLRFQAQELQTALEAAYPGLPADAVRQVLDLFVTENGTKRPVEYERHNGQVILEEMQAERLTFLPLPSVQEILARLEQLRILRFTEDLIELAHDSLAELIDRDRSTEQRQLMEIRARVSGWQREWERSGEYPSRKQLLSVEEYLPRVRMEDNLQVFYDACLQAAEQREQQEQERQQAELEKEKKLRSEAETHSKRARRFTLIALTVSFLALLLAAVSIWQYRTAATAKLRADMARGEAERLKEDAIDKWNRLQATTKELKTVKADNALQERAALATIISLDGQAKKWKKSDLKKAQQLRQEATKLIKKYRKSKEIQRYRKDRAPL